HAAPSHRIEHESRRAGSTHLRLAMRSHGGCPAHRHHRPRRGSLCHTHCPAFCLRGDAGSPGGQLMRQSLWAIAAALMISTASAKPVVEVPSVPPEQLSTMGTRVELRHLLDGQEIAEAPAIAWLGHHDGQLLVELHVSGRNQAPIADRDTLRIFEGPAVEVFLSVMEEPGHGYYHIATNPRAAIYDEFVRDAGWNRNVRWDMPATATLVPSEADSWAVRLEIPLAVLRRRVPEDAPVTTLDQEISLQLGTAAVLADGRNLAVAWSPTNTTFHTPSDFGRLRLLDPIPQFNARVE